MQKRIVWGKIDIVQHEQVFFHDERSLWVAVLAQAVNDLTPKFDESNTGHLERVRQEAVNWFKSPYDGFNSFLGICDLLGLNPDKTRRLVLSNNFKISRNKVLG